MRAHGVEFRYRLGGEEVECVECRGVLKQGRITSHCSFLVCALSGDVKTRGSMLPLLCVRIVTVC